VALFPNDGEVPLFVFDAGYDPIGIGHDLASSRCEVLRDNLVKQVPRRWWQIRWSSPASRRAPAKISSRPAGLSGRPRSRPTMS